jgi:queuine/archaeosine tRNA-ribosyltransferase
MKKILFFLPFWWDHVYSDFEPWTDTWTSDIEHYKFLWELNDDVPFDGVLFSRTRVEASKKKLLEIKTAGGIRNYLRIPNGYPLFGDCGAFGYINNEKPPYEPIETLEFYEAMQYDLACTVDHLIVKATEDQKHDRLEITLTNAEKMINKWNSKKYSYELIGVAQGWNPESYRESVKELLDMNFKYVALGGLVRSTTSDIIRIIRTCYPLWENRSIKVHMFGVSRWGIFPFYQRYGITSFDNAYHRRAWLGGKRNYDLDGEYYTAIRIPLTHRRTKERIPEEQSIFNVLKSYIEGKATVDDVIEALKSYEQKLVDLGIEDVNRFERLKDLEQDYFRTLTDKPWEKCNCSICNKYGVHVCVFRTNERNMRRGFHNLYQFYSRFQMWLKGELNIESKYNTPIYVQEIPIKKLKNKKTLVIAACSQTKIGNTREVKTKAKDMYQGRLFKLTRKLSEKNKWDYVIISAKYGLIDPDEEINGYEKFLKTKKDIIEVKPKVIPKLRSLLLNYDNVLVIAGKNYREVIKELIDDRFLFIKSKGYGDLCSKISDTSKRNTKNLLEYM